MPRLGSETGLSTPVLAPEREPTGLEDLGIDYWDLDDLEDEAGPSTGVLDLESYYREFLNDLGIEAGSSTSPTAPRSSDLENRTDFENERLEQIQRNRVDPYHIRPPTLILARPPPPPAPPLPKLPAAPLPPPPGPPGRPSLDALEKWQHEELRRQTRFNSGLNILRDREVYDGEEEKKKAKKQKSIHEKLRELPLSKRR